MICSHRNGAKVWENDLGLHVFHPDEPGEWLHRLWDHTADLGAPKLAYLAATAGVRLSEAAPVVGHPDRWVRVPDRHR